jgi:hypothetical protein
MHSESDDGYNNKVCESSGKKCLVIKVKVEREGRQNSSRDAVWNDCDAQVFSNSSTI